MGGALINEPPLIVLPTLAKTVGINHAILLQQMHYWLRTSKHEHGGHKWVYNTYAEWQEQLPWLSERGVRKVVNDLERDGYIITGNFNRATFDKTKWYRIDYTLVCQIGQSMCHEVSDDAAQNDTSDASQSVTPIPETTQETTGREDSAPADADRAAAVPAVPEPSEKPRTPKQIENDRRHERRVSLYAAYCDGIGIDADGEAADVYRDRAFRELKPIVDKAAPTPEEFRACTSWMNQQGWRDEPPKVTQVIGSYAGWVSKGRPATPEGAKATPAPKRPAGQRGYSADELMDMYRRSKQGRGDDGYIDTTGRTS